MPKLHINDNGVWKAIDAGNADQLEGKTKTEVLQEAANLAGSAGVGSPNILINTDVLHAINQRNFNGNWGGISVGSYGYDRWLKADTTNKGQIVESGNFVAGGTYTLGYNIANVRTHTQLTAPASGHWLVKVPFAADKLDLYLGAVERPWVPKSLGEVLAECQRYYVVEGVADSSNGSWIGLIQFYTTDSMWGALNLPVTMRAIPTVSGVAGTVSKAPNTRTRTRLLWYSNTAEVINSYKADAELTLGDL